MAHFSYFRTSLLNELALKSPSDVMSRYSTLAKNFGSTHVAFGLRVGLVSLSSRWSESKCFGSSDFGGRSCEGRLLLMNGHRQTTSAGPNSAAAGDMEGGSA